MRALVAAFLLAVPVALAGGSETTDPEGDEAFVDPVMPIVCHDPAVDITRLAVASDGETLEVRIGFRDLDARPSCEAASLPRRQLERGFAAPRNGTIELRFHEYTFNFWDMHGGLGVTQRNVCGSFGIYEFSENGYQWWASRCMGETLVDGDTLVWRVPTHGVAPTYGTRVFAYDLRGKAFDGHAYGWSQVAPGAMTVVRPVVIDPFYFADTARLASPFTV